MNPKKQQRRILKLAIAFSIALFISLEASGILQSSHRVPAYAQNLRPEEVALQVYQRLPYLPKENDYLDKETGEVEANNTLLSRLIRYHQFVKNRPGIFRLDWKLTLADYLGVNELIREAQYPGSSLFKENPLERDRAAIGSLNRRERDELVEVLVGIYNPRSREAASDNAPKSEPPSPASSPPLPQPGDARLLAP